jgi:hypothetical protein
MNVLLGGVDGLAPEVLGHRLWADTCERPVTRSVHWLATESRLKEQLHCTS